MFNDLRKKSIDSIDDSDRSRLVALENRLALARQKSLVSGDISTTLSGLSSGSTLQNFSHRALPWIPESFPTPNWVKKIPSLLVFARGLIFFREAWQIYTFSYKESVREISPTEQNLRLLTALTGGFVAIGSFMVNLLLQFKVGLLATPTAIALTPIVLTSIGIGFYCMTLFRDLYCLREIRNAILSLPLEAKHADADSIPLTYLALKELRSKQWELGKNIIFGAIGTLGTVLALSLAILSLTASTTGLGGLFFASALLISISSATPLWELTHLIAKKSWNFVHKYIFKSATSNPNADPAPRIKNTPQSNVHATIPTPVGSENTLPHYGPIFPRPTRALTTHFEHTQPSPTPRP